MVKSTLFRWFTINLIISVLIHFPGYREGMEFWTAFSLTFLVTNLISLSAAFTGSRLYSAAESVTMNKIIYIITPTAAAVSVIIATVIVILYEFLTPVFGLPGRTPFDYFSGLYIPAIILSSSLTFLNSYNEFRTGKTENQTDAQSIKDDRETIKREGISVKSGDKHFFIPYSGIIYISSAGKRTVIHTAETEHITYRLLKSFLPDLPEGQFMRVHRGYIINLNYISHIQYDIGGSYTVTLKDEEATSLPVGRDNAPLLKEFLGVH